MTVGLVTDSNAQLPLELVEHYRVEVVPLTVVVDGMPLLEGVDLDADPFYARFESGTPTVSTAHPSPGQFAAAFAAQAARGADEVLAVLIGSNVSGTVNAARLAAEAVGRPRWGTCSPSAPSNWPAPEDASPTMPPAPALASRC